MKHLKLLNKVLLIFCIWTAIVFFLKSAGFLQLDFLAFKLDAAHFLSRAIVYLGVVFFWMWFSKKKNLFENEYERQISILLLLITLTLDNFGNLFGWYRIETERGIIWYDKLVHFINSGLYTSFFYLILKNTYRKAPFTLILLASLGITITFSALFEVFELTSDVLWDTSMVGGVEDIILDLTMNLSGALLAILLISAARIKKTSP